jgi:MoxR-like ATPase
MEETGMSEDIEQQGSRLTELRAELSKVLVGQETMVNRLLIGLLCRGHVLLEGVPGLAKTLTVRLLAQAVDTGFSRIQFTPDMLPADVIGTQIFNPRDATYSVKKGPIFSNLVLADEINRAPAKVQAALLEAMEERQVSIGDTSYPLEDPFLVLATQNPVEQEGTYPLPEAQIDRFMLKVKVDYPARDEERQILERMMEGEEIPVEVVANLEDILRLREATRLVYVDDKIKDYIVDLVQTTRRPAEAGLAELAPLIEYGASPRATLFLARAARAHAFIRRRGYVTPEDVKAVGPDVLRHRVATSYEAEAEEIDSDRIVEQLFDHVEVP